MDDILASMWNALSLSESESVTLTIDNLKLSTHNFALIGKLAMKKYISTVDVDKFLKKVWNTANSMETTCLGENIYLFSLSEAGTIERILAKQPWNLRGLVLILGQPLDNVAPSDMQMFFVPFWIQIHGLTRLLERRSDR